MIFLMSWFTWKSSWTITLKLQVLQYSARPYLYGYSNVSKKS